MRRAKYREPPEHRPVARPAAQKSDGPDAAAHTESRESALLHLQRTAGNAAVRGLVGGGGAVAVQRDKTKTEWTLEKAGARFGDLARDSKYTKLTTVQRRGNDVAQQADAQPVLLRQSEPSADKGAPAQTSHTQWAPADAVVEIRWLYADDWEITLSGRTSADSARALLWPKWMPSTITMTLKVAITDPIERGWFTISGLEAFHLEYMEPSIAALFRDRGLVDEPAVNATWRKPATRSANTIPILASGCTAQSMWR